MTEEQFNALVKRLEGNARRNPGLYKLQVGLLAMLGYVYIFSAIAILFAALALLVLMIIYSKRIHGSTIQLAIALMGVIFIIARSLWVTMSPPNGIYLTRRSFPLLFQHLDKLTKNLKAPRCHHVILTGEFNAGVMQVSRLGVFGWPQNYLIIGLPLMQALSPDRFRAVLAHEFGHLSGNHGRFGGWIYHQRQTWMGMLERLHQSQHGWATFFFQLFLSWYAPFFNAYSFVLARANEYEADRCAAKMAGTRTAAEALIEVAVKGRRLGEAWSDIYRQAGELPDPPEEVFGEIDRALTAEANPEKERKWLSLALAEQTNNEDTHPCLQERLKALRYQTHPLPDPPKPMARSAAEEYLQQNLSKVTSALGVDWRTSVNFQWRQRYVELQEYRMALEKLERKAETTTLTVEERWQRARLTMELEGTDKIKPLLEDILTLDANHVGANFYLGQMLLEAGDEEGMGYVRKAIAEDANVVVPGCQLIYAFLQGQKRTEEAEQYRQQAEGYHQELVLAQEERNSITVRDRFKPHGLSPEKVRSLREQIAAHSEVERVYLVQKAVKHLPEKPFYILMVRRKRGFFEADEAASDRAFLRRFAESLTFPGETSIVVVGSRNKAIEKAIRKAVEKPFYLSTKLKNLQK
ncbi:MAG: M48 family metalloprotease [Spirulina sp.]